MFAFGTCTADHHNSDITDMYDKTIDRVQNMRTFAQRVDATLRAETGGLGIWDLVGDWPEADFSAQNDVDGAIQWILDEAGESHMWV